LAKEERLYKKLRRGKITQAQYDELLRGNPKSADKASKQSSGVSDDESTSS